MSTTKFVSAQKIIARIAIVGAIAAVPLAAAAAPALADVPLDTQVTEVSRPHGPDRNDRNPWPGWNADNPWANNDNHHHGRWHNDNPKPGWRDNHGWQQVVPRGMFGSS